jgi:hypothetical protein
MWQGNGTSNDRDMPAAFPNLVRQILHTADNATVAAIQAHYDYAANPPSLAWDWTTDIIFACNAENTAAAYRDRARRYIMSIPPAVHGADISCELFSPTESIRPW